MEWLMIKYLGNSHGSGKMRTVPRDRSQAGTPVAGALAARNCLRTPCQSVPRRENEAGSTQTAVDSHHAGAYRAQSGLIVTAGPQAET